MPGVPFLDSRATPLQETAAGPLAGLWLGPLARASDYVMELVEWSVLDGCATNTQNELI